MRTSAGRFFELEDITGAGLAKTKLDSTAGDASDSELNEFNPKCLVDELNVDELNQGNIFD